MCPRILVWEVPQESYFAQFGGSQRSSKPGSSQGPARNAGARLDSARASGTPEMRLLGDHRPGSGSDPWQRWQLAQSSVTDGELARPAGWAFLGRGRTSLGFRALLTRNRAQDQGRASEVARMEHLVYLRFEVWKGVFETPGTVAIRVPAVPDTDFGPNGEVVTANPQHRSHLEAAYPPNPLYPSRFSEYGGHRPFWPKSR